MRRAVLLVALAVLAWPACGGSTAAVVHVTTRPDHPLQPGTDFQSLRFHVTRDGDEVVTPVVRAMGASDTFPQTLTLLPGSETEDAALEVEVEAVATGDVAVSRASAALRFRPGEVVDVYLDLIGP